jgi:hypothetical protein
MIRFDNTVHFAALLLIGGGLAGCSAAASPPDRRLSENAGYVRVPLTTLGNHSLSPYKLGPATFEIDGPPGGPFQPLTVSADGDQPTLDVPLDPGYYTVTLQSGWTLQEGTTAADDAGTQWSPVAATLTSPNPQMFSIQPYQATDVTFDFHLGVSEVTLGISVDEGLPKVPPGYDGVIWPSGTQWEITLASGWGACCWPSAASLLASYPNLKLYVSH